MKRNATGGLFLLVLAATALVLAPGCYGQDSYQKKVVKNENGDVRMLRGKAGAVVRGDSAPRYKDGELIVKFKVSVSESAMQAKHQRLQAKVLRHHQTLRLQRVSLKEGMTVDQAIAQYKADPDVEYAEPNYLVSAQNTPNDPNYGQLWGMAAINAPAAWDLTTGNGNTVIAILDTGIDYTHPDLAGNLWVNQGELNGAPGADNDGDGYPNDIYGYNAITGTGDPKDDHYHGTHVAGTIGAAGNNGIGVTGVAWNTKLMACKFLDDSGSGTIDDAIECLQYVKNMKARGVNIAATSNSWGMAAYSQSLYDAIRDQKDILFVAAAGNNNSSETFYPAGYDLPNIISVAASAQFDDRASFSNYGKWTVDVAAPGTNIYSTFPGADYRYLSGTSMATPHVSGLAALLSAQVPGRTAATLKNLILTGGDPVPAFADLTVTGKRINAYNSLVCSDSPLFAVLHLITTPQPGVSQKVSAISINCGAPVGPVTMTVAGGVAIQLHDDGVAPDETAGDGIFTGTWTPASSAVASLTFSSPLGTVAASSPPVTIAGQPTISSSAALLPNSVTSADTNAAFSQIFATSGGLPPFSWSLTGGVLPSGLTLNSQTGEISGTATAAGVFPITLQVADSTGTKGWKNWTLLLNDGLRARSPRELQQRVGSGFLPASSSPLIADLDGDGKDEIVVSDVDTLYVIYPDGSMKKTVLPGEVSSPVAADLDGDGKSEIIVSVGYSYSSSNTIYAFHCDLTSVTGFPAGSYPTLDGGPGQVSAPVVADFNNDGRLKIAVVTSPDNMLDPNFGKNVIIMVDSDGSLVPGWPQPAGNNDYDCLPPAVADLDHNGKKALVTASVDGYIREFRPDGTLRNQWQFDAGTVLGAWNPVLADMDGDGYPDVVVKYDDATYTDVLKVFDRNGNLLPGWPKTLFGSGGPFGVVVADVDGDGRPEIVMVAGAFSNELHVLKGDGSYLPGWPASLSASALFDCYPVVADVDGDGKQEVMVTAIDANDNGVVVGFSAAGTPLAGFPKYASPASDIRSTAAIGDVDGNGKLDLVVKSENGYLYVWEMAQQATGRPLQWPMLRNDKQHSGSWVTDRLTVAPASYDFGTALAGSTPATGTFTIFNPLYTAVTVSSIAFTGPDSSMFAVTGGSCGNAPFILDPLQTCSATVSFAPSSGGVKQAGLSVLTTSPGLTGGQTGLSGTGTQSAYRLSFTRLGGGGGAVASSTGISYSDSGSETLPVGSTVTLTASAAAGSIFTGWAGACTGTGDCTCSIDGDKQVSASFESSVTPLYQLTINETGSANGSLFYTPGGTCRGGCTRLYAGGAVVTLTPILSTEASFTRWSGCDSVSGTTCTVAMNSAKTVSASFRGNAGVIAGQYHSLALKEDGTLWAWGSNWSGTLGDGTTIGRSTPVEVIGLTGVVAATASRSAHNAALKADGTVWTWGDNSYGQLGDGTTRPSSKPVQVTGVAGVVAVDAGVYTVALKGDGTVWGWGYNEDGEIGDGSTTNRLTPVQVPGISGAVAIAAGVYHTIALKGDGTVWAWGANYAGQLGDGSYTDHFTPTKLSTISGVVAIAAGNACTYAMKSDGTVWAWGNDYYGQIGDGSSDGNRPTPLKLTALSGVAALAGGESYTLATGIDGTLSAWGDNSRGQLGDGTTTQRNDPFQVPGITGVSSAAAGEYHTLALKQDGTVWAWGANDLSQLGDNTSTDRYTPVQVQNFSVTAAPVTSVIPAGGTYYTPQNVTLISNKPATIYYTLDGSLPTVGSAVYTAPIAVSASTTLSYFAKDAAGNAESVKSQSYLVDPLPAAAVSGVPVSATNATTANLTVGGSGVVAYKCKVDGGSYSDETAVNSPIVLASLSEASHTVSVLGKDAAGKWQMVPTVVSWSIDLTPPIATVSGAPPSPTNLPGATLAVGGADVVSYRYRIDAGAYSQEQPVAAALDAGSLGDGQHTVSVLGKDTAGNWQITPTVVGWTVDTAAPTTTRSPAGNYLVASETVTLSCSDGTGAGCAGTFYCLGTGCMPATPYAGPIAVSAATDLRFYSRDLAGNSEAVETATYTVLASSYLVQLAVAGTGSGKVTSTPAGIDASGSIAASFTGGSSVTLRASAGAFSIFEGWAGACSGTGDCALFMIADQAPSATFNIDSAHSTYIPTGSGTYSSTIQDAINAAGGSDIIRLWGIQFTENLLFSKDEKITLSGGYDQAYNSPNGKSLLSGSLRISGGTVNIAGLAIR